MHKKKILFYCTSLFFLLMLITVSILFYKRVIPIIHSNSCMKNESNVNFYSPFSVNKIVYFKDNNSTFHFLGLLSDGNVHSNISHLLKMLEQMKNNDRDMQDKIISFYMKILEQKAKEYKKEATDKIEQEKQKLMRAKTENEKKLKQSKEDIEKKTREFRNKADEAKKGVEQRLERTKKNYTDQKTKLEDAARKGVSFKVNVGDNTEEVVTCGCNIF